MRARDGANQLSAGGGVARRSLSSRRRRWSKEGNSTVFLDSSTTACRAPNPTGRGGAPSGRAPVRGATSTAGGLTSHAGCLLRAPARSRPAVMSHSFRPVCFPLLQRSRAMAASVAAALLWPALSSYAASSRYAASCHYAATLRLEATSRLLPVRTAVSPICCALPDAASMRVKELKEELDRLGVAWKGIASEKDHLVKMVEDARASPPRPPPPSRPPPAAAPPRASPSPSAPSSRSAPPIEEWRRSTSPGLKNNFYDVHISDFKKPYGGPESPPPPDRRHLRHLLRRRLTLTSTLSLTLILTTLTLPALTSPNPNHPHPNPNPNPTLPGP